MNPPMVLPTLAGVFKGRPDDDQDKILRALVGATMPGPKPAGPPIPPSQLPWPPAASPDGSQWSGGQVEALAELFGIPKDLLPLILDQPTVPGRFEDYLRQLGLSDIGAESLLSQILKTLSFSLLSGAALGPGPQGQQALEALSGLVGAEYRQRQERARQILDAYETWARQRSAEAQRLFNIARAVHDARMREELMKLRERSVQVSESRAEAEKKRVEIAEESLKLRQVSEHRREMAAQMDRLLRHIREAAQKGVGPEEAYVSYKELMELDAVPGLDFESFSRLYGAYNRREKLDVVRVARGDDGVYAIYVSVDPTSGKMTAKTQRVLRIANDRSIPDRTIFKVAEHLARLEFTTGKFVGPSEAYSVENVGGKTVFRSGTQYILNEKRYISGRSEELIKMFHMSVDPAVMRKLRESDPKKAQELERLKSEFLGGIQAFSLSLPPLSAPSGEAQPLPGQSSPAEPSPARPGQSLGERGFKPEDENFEEEDELLGYDGGEIDEGVFERAQDFVAWILNSQNPEEQLEALQLAIEAIRRAGVVG